MTYYRFTSPDNPAAEPWGSCAVFYVDEEPTLLNARALWSEYGVPCEQGENKAPPWVGWYWQPCHPGCLPDGEPVGPFATEAEAMADAGVAP